MLSAEMKIAIAQAVREAGGTEKLERVIESQDEVSARDVRAMQEKLQGDWELRLLNAFLALSEKLWKETNTKKVSKVERLRRMKDDMEKLLELESEDRRVDAAVAMDEPEFAEKFELFETEEKLFYLARLGFLLEDLDAEIPLMLADEILMLMELWAKLKDS